MSLEVARVALRPGAPRPAAQWTVERREHVEERARAGPPAERGRNGRSATIATWAERVSLEVARVALRRATPVPRAKQAASIFVPRLNGAGMSQRGIRYLLEQSQEALPRLISCYRPHGWRSRNRQNWPAA